MRGVPERSGVRVVTTSSSYRMWGLVALAAAALLGFFVLDPIAQDEAYHHFADERPWLGIPNFLNVATNLPFAVVGALGLWRASRPGGLTPTARVPWLVFFVGVLLVAVGSAYYHWQPDSQRLVWDRLPMTLAFMGLTVALSSEWVSPRSERLLPLGLLLGVGSVLVWVQSGDLRLYYGVQLMPMVVAAAVLVLFRAPYSHTWHLGVAVLLYALAKVVEATDHAIFEATAGALSGHPVKHLFAAGATYWILEMLRVRRAKSVASAA